MTEMDDLKVRFRTSDLSDRNLTVDNNRDPSPPATPEQTYLQRLVSALRTSLASLGTEATNRQLESWSCLIHESMSAQGRNYHSVQHVFDISVNSVDPILILSALFHDAIYYSIDGELSPRQAEILRGVLDAEEEAKGKLVLAKSTDRDEDPLLATVSDIFGFRPGQVLEPFGGLNEFLSAVLAVRCLDGALNVPDLAQIAVCIEATIPFRKDDEATGRTAMDQLHDKLCDANETYALGLAESDLVAAVRRAVDLSNRDVGNFQTTDHGMFLDNTWKLLPESNAALRLSSNCYKISDYQLAMKKMAGFFAHLDPAVIFQSFRGVPDADAIDAMTERARRNLDVSLRYIQAKALAISVLAALAEKTGGDAPVSLFLGDLPGPDGHRPPNVEDYLPAPGRPSMRGITDGPGSSRHIRLDYNVYDLLECGRLSASSFDLDHSPLAALLYGLVGNAGLDGSLEFAVHPMDASNADRLLRSLPRDAVAVIAGSCARIAPTRSDELHDISVEFEGDDGGDGDGDREDGAPSVHAAQPQSTDSYTSAFGRLSQNMIRPPKSRAQPREASRESLVAFFETGTWQKWASTSLDHSNI